MTERVEQPAIITGTGPRGAVWLVVAFYLFAAFIILTSWMTDNSRTNYASSAPTPTHHSMHDAAAASSGAATR